MLIRDIELEQMNPKQAREYIGRKVRQKTAFRPYTLPLDAIKSINSKEP